MKSKLLKDGLRKSTNNLFRRLVLWIFPLFYDAADNYVYGRVIERILDPGEEYEMGVFIFATEVFEQVDHFDYFVSAMQYD